MNDDEDGDTLSVSQQERLDKFIAHMNVFSQHQKAMAESVKPKETTVKQKIKKSRYGKYSGIQKEIFRES